MTSIHLDREIQQARDELERMGDHVKEIATINLHSGDLSMPKILRDIQYEKVIIDADNSRG